MATIVKNPIFIPKSFSETNRDGEETRYVEKQIAERRVRVMEYRDRNGLLTRANIWGICGELKELEDCLVAYDKPFDAEALSEIRKPAEEMYPKPVKLTFF